MSIVDNVKNMCKYQPKRIQDLDLFTGVVAQLLPMPKSCFEYQPKRMQYLDLFTGADGVNT